MTGRTEPERSRVPVPAALANRVNGHGTDGAAHGTDATLGAVRLGRVLRSS